MEVSCVHGYKPSGSIQYSGSSSETAQLAVSQKKNSAPWSYFPIIKETVCASQRPLDSLRLEKTIAVPFLNYIKHLNILKRTPWP
jgi:hypothetical protein